MKLSALIFVSLFFSAIISVEVEVGGDGSIFVEKAEEETIHLKNYHESDTSTIELNKRVESRVHPNTYSANGVPTTACAAKFRSLSSRKIDMWWDNGSDGIFAGSLKPSEIVTANSYGGHVFYFTAHKNKSEEILRITIDPDKVYYHIYDPVSPGNQDDIDLTKAEEAFGEEYFKKTGRKWRQYFGPDGPRPPPVLHMWPTESIGQVHGVITSHSYWNCEGPEAICQDDEELELDLEVISVTPKILLIENFLNDFEADTLIEQAKAAGSINSSSAVEGSIPTATRYWVKRDANDVTDTLVQRAGDVLGIDESLLVNTKSAEDLQVLHYTLGQKYDNHHDWGVKGYYESRYVTMLLYLSSQDNIRNGGETAFPKALNSRGINIRPQKGMAVLFYNLLEDGNGDDLAVHAALPVLGGEKWMANFWVWDPKRFSNCGRPGGLGARPDTTDE